MLTYLRFALLTTILVAVQAIIYFRVGQAHLFDMVGEGPFSGVIGQMEAVIPITLGLWLLAAWGLVFWSRVQRERSRVVGGVRRR